MCTCVGQHGTHQDALLSLAPCFGMSTTAVPVPAEFSFISKEAKEIFSESSFDLLHILVSIHPEMYITGDIISENANDVNRLLQLFGLSALRLSKSQRMETLHCLHSRD